MGSDWRQFSLNSNSPSSAPEKDQSPTADVEKDTGASNWRKASLSSQPKVSGEDKGFLERAWDYIPAWDSLPAPAEVYRDAINQKPMMSPEEQNAAWHGAAQGVTLGYSPQIQGAYNSALNPDLTYEQARDAANQKEAELEGKYPRSYMGGELAGAVALPIPGTAEIKESSLLSRLGKASAQGAALGALSNPGDVEGQSPSLQLKERLRNATGGALVGPLAEGISSAAGKTSDLLQKLKERIALKTAGAQKPQFKEILKKVSGPELQSFMDKEGMLRPGANAESVFNHSNDVIDESGEELGKMYGELSNASGKEFNMENATPEQISKVSTTRPSATDLADDFMFKAKEEYGAGKAGGQQGLKSIEGELNNLRALGPDASISQLVAYRTSLGNDLKAAYKAGINSATDPSLAIKADLRDFVDKAIDKHAAALADATGNQRLVNEMEAQQKRYSLAKKVNEISLNRVAANHGRDVVMNMIAGGGLGAAAGLASGKGSAETSGYGLLGTAGLMAARKFGPGLAYLAAKAAKPIARGISNMPSSGTVIPWLLMNKNSHFNQNQEQ